MLGSQKATIELLAVSANRARVGIDAPRQIKVLREEILDKANSESALRETV
jgi:carbon storage regulator CsrA